MTKWQRITPKKPAIGKTVFLANEEHPKGAPSTRTRVNKDDWADGSGDIWCDYTHYMEIPYLPKKLHKVEPDEDFTPKAYRGQIIKDAEPFIDPIEGKVIGGNRQKREFMRKHEVIDVGNERMETKKKELPPVAEDLKRAWSEVESR